MAAAISPFIYLVIETYSLCNRKCGTCLRQTDLARTRWSNNRPIAKFLETEIVERILDQARELPFQGPVCLQFFNEPLMDPRLPRLSQYAKKRGFSPVFVSSNGDLLTPELAADLDGVLDEIYVALYDRDDVVKLRERQDYLMGLFHKTKVIWAAGTHFTTHHSPNKNLEKLIEKYRMEPCLAPLRQMIVSYTGDLALCCEDIQLNWNLGNIRDHSVRGLWYREKHQNVVNTLSQPGGRAKYPYCRICPVSLAEREVERFSVREVR